ncbi:conserved Plasmodium protein, unknown function [Plasmodium knowlesi strain H]|uniref:Helicase n=3 Tax=Plasmodium knowlesi TaxID=5850 RepID=A0A5K1UCN8_PLAKH|nr:helicase, putative [Plasmodium knowlesi strain H]OTN63958.1 Uncharacterized protein PKNOH_S140271800 [Plasmodium knowlesi]CAA9991132.1 helicase, putative [Plasmodium knowlesi strain H]SBO20553.1 conserved Plasmodium protein, unknown function [Plasmodium knowlesi strain H]SBO20935.1 conserved Plasmodium protein, unknown function [Plasmodium knowlesi strain H]VVS80606.1 helicase, putative [Plasmodium knowlesi strain H]|eukprot:XP_002262416.1 hypothetical protein, conserved in Plasmodium species [Plasmodium knowlesi strain H]
MNPYTIKRTYECLYTHQKIQKNKKWQEGYCEVIASYGGIKMNLLNQSRTCIESSLSCEASFNNLQEEIELPKHLIQFVDVTNYAEDVIKCETSKKRRTLCTSQDEGSIHANKNKKITTHSGVNNSRECMGSETPGVGMQYDATTFNDFKTDRYIRVNRKFEMPRRIKRKVEVERHEDPHGEATQYLEDDHSGDESSEGEFPNIVKKKKTLDRTAPCQLPHNSDNDERITVSYTNIRTFNNNKKNVKWYDGFIVKKNDLLELYNNSGGRLYIRSTDESIQQEEYIQFGSYIVCNDFRIHSSGNPPESVETNPGKNNGMSKKVDARHGEGIPAQLHQVSRRKGDSEGDTNVDEEEVDLCSDDNSRVNSTVAAKRRVNEQPDAKAVSLLNKYVRGEELPACPSEENPGLMDISSSKKKKLRRDDRGGESDSPGDASSEEHRMYHQRCDKYRKDYKPNERQRRDKIGFPLYKESGGRSAAYLCSSCRQEVKTYKEIINIARVVSQNNFSWVNPHRNIIRLNLGIKLLSMRMPGELHALLPPGGEDSGHDRDGDPGIVRRPPCWSCTNGENRTYWNCINDGNRPCWNYINDGKQLCWTDMKNEERHFSNDLKNEERHFSNDMKNEEQHFSNDMKNEKRPLCNDRNGDMQPYGSDKSSERERPCGSDRVHGEKQPCGSDRVHGEKQPCESDRVHDEKQLCGSDRVHGEKQLCGSDRVQGEKQPCESDRRDSEKHPCGSSTEANSNEEEPGEEGTSETEWDTKKGEKNVEMVREICHDINPPSCPEMIPEEKCSEELPKLESTIERTHLNPYKIESLKNFASTNSGFDASQIDQVRRQNLFLPIYVSILKEKEELKKKLQKIKFKNIPNFFLNKLEYIHSFMNATLLQIHYQIQCKLLCLHGYLIPLLCEMRGDYLRGGSIMAYRRMLHSVGQMTGQFIHSRSDEDLPSDSRDVQTNHPNEEGNKRRKYSHGEDDYTLFIQNVEVLCSTEEETRYMFHDNEQENFNLNSFDGETDMQGKRFFIRRTQKEVLLVNKKKKNKLTMEEDINKYVYMNHLIVMSRDISPELNMSYPPYPPFTSSSRMKDSDLLLFVTKWNNFKKNYLEIYPVNLETLSYMNQTFQDEEYVKSKEFLYFLKEYKVKVFRSCLFLVNLGNHIDNLKYLFFFHQNLKKEIVPPPSTLFPPPYVDKEDTLLHLDGFFRQIGIKTSAWGSSCEPIDLYNVGGDYMDDLLNRVRKDEQLNERQSWVIECMLAWFRCRMEKKENEIETEENFEEWEKCETEDTFDPSETMSSTDERSEDELSTSTYNGICTTTHRGDSILVNGIFGSGKSTLICKAILYLDKVLTQEERGKKRRKAEKCQKRNQERNEDMSLECSQSGGSEEKSSDKTSDLPMQVNHRRISQEKKKKILLMCNTNLAVDNILLKLKFHFDFHDYARIGNIFEINFFLITNFISINSNDQKKTLEVKNYVQSLARSTNLPPTKNQPTTDCPPTDCPPTDCPPTDCPPTDYPPTDHPPTDHPPTDHPPTNGPTTASSSPSRSGTLPPTPETKLHKIKDMDKLADALMKKNNFVFRNKFKNKRVIAGTCKSLQIYEKLSSIKESIDYLIVDECTQIDEMTLFHFFLKFGIRKFLLIGDVKQLGVVLKGPSDLRRSMFSRLVENELFIAHHLKETDMLAKDEATGTAGVDDEIMDRIVNRVRSMREAEYSALKSYLYDNMFALHGGGGHTYEGDQVNVENLPSQPPQGVEDKAIERVPPRTGMNHLILMNEQFRCHPEISAICSHLFYNGLIKNAKCTETIPLIYKPYGSHVNFILLKKAPSEVTFRSSFTSAAEARVILTLCENMLASSINPEQIGIISLFRNQTFYIKNKMKESPYYERLRNVKVSTVDSFQGIEKDIILFSCVLGEVSGINRVGRFRQNQSTPWRDDYFQAFCNNSNRINVALSRAKSQLIIVAQSSFVEGNHLWSYIKSHSKVYHCE